MKTLYKNIGDKVCKIAKFCGLIGVIGVVVGVILICINLVTWDDFIAGIASTISGLMLIISSWPLYAFGQITNDIREIKNNTATGNGTVSNDLPEL